MLYLLQPQRGPQLVTLEEHPLCFSLPTLPITATLLDMLGYPPCLHKRVVLYRPKDELWMKVELDESIVVANGDVLCFRTPSICDPLGFNHSKLYHYPARLRNIDLDNTSTGPVSRSVARFLADSDEEDEPNVSGAGTADDPFVMV